jgi:RNA polymerase subunit RPABC4/transcription elongation factor Spt4
MNKKPRFFCDNCGYEVDRDAKACAHCGRFFASVRCPSCGYTSSEKAFSNGCPSCGYSAPPAARPAEQPEQTLPARPLPLWVYILSICAFIAVCAVLVSKLLQ